MRSKNFYLPTCPYWLEQQGYENSEPQFFSTILSIRNNVNGRDHVLVPVINSPFIDQSNGMQYIENYAHLPMAAYLRRRSCIGVTSPKSPFPPRPKKRRLFFYKAVSDEIELVGLVCIPLRRETISTEGEENEDVYNVECGDKRYSRIIKLVLN